MAGSYNLGTAEGTIRINYDGKGATQAQQGLQNVEQSGGKAGSSLANAGTKMAIAGGVIAAGIGYATSKAIGFEKEISAIGAVSDANGKQLDALRQKALKLGADTQFSASEAASAMEELAKAGVSVPDILNGAADAATALAAAGGVSLPTAATLAANAMNSFNIKASELKGVVDTIAGAANASAIDVGQFGESLQQVGAVANLSGLSFHDTAVAIAELGNAGIKGSDAGTSLKTFLQNLIPTTKQQKELFDQLGITVKGAGNQFFDAAGKAKSLADISQVLQNATKNMSEEQKLATLQTLFGSDAIRAAAVFADQGATGFNKLAASMDKTSAADVAAARMNNAAGQIEQLKGSVETAGIAFGELLLPRITATAKVLTQLANWLNNLNPLWKGIILDVLGVVSGLLLFTAAAVKIFQFVKAFQELAKAIKAIEIAEKLAGAATKIWAAAQWLLDAALSPIGLVVLAIVAVGVAIFLVIKYHQQIWAAIQKVWHGFLGLVSSVWEWIKSHWPLLVAILGGPFIALAAIVATSLNSIKNFFIGIFTAIGNFAKGIVGAIGGLFTALGGIILKALQIAFGPIISILAPAFVAFFNFITALVRLFVSVVTAIWAVFWTLFKAVAIAALTPLAAAWNAFWNLLKTVASAVWTYIINYIRVAVGIIISQFQALQALASIVWNAIWGVIRVVVDALVGYLVGKFNQFLAFWTGVWNAISGAAQAVANFLAPFVSAFVNALVGTLRVGAGTITAVWGSIWNAARAIVIGASNVIVAILRAFVSFIVGIFNGLTSIVNAFRRFFDQLHAAANGGTGTLIAFIRTIPGKILSALGNMYSMLYGSGRALIQGFINGVADMAGALYAKVEGILNKVRNLWPFSPAKEGPFSGRGWTLYSGQAVMDAFGEGAVDRADSVRSAIANALTPAQGALSDASLVATTTSGLVPFQAPRQLGSGDMPPVSVVFEEGAINVDADGNITLDPKKVAIAANEGNRQLGAFRGGRTG